MTKFEQYIVIEKGKIISYKNESMWVFNNYFVNTASTLEVKNPWTSKNAN